MSGGEQVTEIAYEGLLPVTVTERGFTPEGAPVERRTAFAYTANGQLAEIDGPRADIPDITPFAYHECATGGACGQLRQVSNALGQVTAYDAYDTHGRPTRITDPNGLVTSIDYDMRGRVTRISEASPDGSERATAYVYDAAGQLQTLTLPDGVTRSFVYDAAHRLREASDNLGNRVTYSYDPKGNRTADQVYDPDGTLVRSLETAYDPRDRVAQLNAAGSLTGLVFDAVGDLLSETDPNGAKTAHRYDPLRRLSETVDALNGVTRYLYDVRDRLIQVEAPNAATTTYMYDDLDNLLQEAGPDRGTISFYP